MNPAWWSCYFPLVAWLLQLSPYGTRVHLISVIQPLKKIPNFAARLILLASPGKTALASLFRMCEVWSRLHVFQCYKWFWSCLPFWTATCLCSVSYTMLFFWHLHAEDPTIETQDSWLSHFFLLWTAHLEFTPTRTSWTLLNPVIF